MSLIGNRRQRRVRPHDVESMNMVAGRRVHRSGAALWRAGVIGEVLGNSCAPLTTRLLEHGLP